MSKPKKGTPQYANKIEKNRIRNKKKYNVLKEERLRHKARFIIKKERLDAAADAKERAAKAVKRGNRYMRRAHNLEKAVRAATQREDAAVNRANCHMRRAHDFEVTLREIRAEQRKDKVRLWAMERELEHQKELNRALIGRLANRQRMGKRKGK